MSNDANAFMGVGDGSGDNNVEEEGAEDQSSDSLLNSHRRSKS